MRRISSVGAALALVVGTFIPAAHADTTGKTLVMGFSQEPDTFVASEGGLYASQVATNLVYSSLIVTDDLMRPIPDLALDVPTLDNGEAVLVGDGADQHLETTFKLNQRARFSDGSPVSADDVVFSWKLSLNPVWGAPAGNDLESKYSDVVKKDNTTVVFKMFSENQAHAAGMPDQRGPVVHPFYLFGLPDVFIYPARRMGSLVDGDPQYSPKVKDLQSSIYSRQPVGSGPYSLESWDPGVQMTFRARADYFRGKPAIDTIVVRGFEASKETLLAQLRSGDIQTIGSDTLDVTDVDAVNQISGVRAFVRAGTTVEHIDLNLDDPILSDKIVRKAIIDGIDRQDLVNRVLAGQSSIADSVIPPISVLFNPNTTRYPFNPAQARSILDADGWTMAADGIRAKNGQRLSLRFQSTNSDARHKTLPLVKDALANIGVEVNIDQIPAQTFFGPTGPMRRATYQLGEYASAGSADSGVDVVTEYGSSFIPSDANNFGGQNFPHWRNASADQLIAQQANTLSMGQRKGAMAALQLLLAEELPSIPLYFQPNVTAASMRLVNYKPEYASNGYNWNVWEWDLR